MADPRRLSARRIGQLLLVPVWLVVAGLGVLALARMVAFDRARVLALADAYTLFVYLPAYPIAVAALCFRRSVLAACTLLLVAAHLYWVVPPTLRAHATGAPRDAPRLRIVTANVRYDNGDHTDLPRELASYRADVVVLEEVTPEWWDAIARSPLVSVDPFHVVSLRGDPGGMAILAREPFVSTLVRPLAGSPDWASITVALQMGRSTVHVVGVHTTAPIEAFGRYHDESRALAGEIRTTPEPRVVAGDFNATPYNRLAATVRGLGLREAHESVGRWYATTWPNGVHFLPSIRLDHVFADPAFVVTRAAEGRGAGSDHRPVIVDLALVR